MRISLVGAALAALSLAACGNAGTSQKGQSPPATSQSRTENNDALAHSANGTVEKLAVGQATIAHGPVKTLRWPAMTMTFSTKDTALLKGIPAGGRVAFSFIPSGGAYALTAISKR